MNHIWHAHPKNPEYQLLQGISNALVRTEPMPDGRYLWQFRRIASYADTVESAKLHVEAGAEYFETFRRNPYAR